MISMQIDISTLRNVSLTAPILRSFSGAMIERLLFHPANLSKLGEGGLRTQDKFKLSQPGKPLVSILIAVFNGEQFLEQTIKSVLDQDYDNIELIVIDGGSTDGTVDVLRKYEHALDYWISEPDRGISDAFNKAVLLSSGNYLNFQGAGDLLVSNDVVTRMMESINPQRDMLISARVQRVKENDPNEVLWITPRRFSSSFNKRSLLFRMSLPHQGLLVNSRMFERYGLFDINNVFSMDYEHLLRAYHEFPHVVMKDVIFSAWREGGVGTGRISNILNEYNRIKIKNQVAPAWMLRSIDIYTKLKFKLKTRLGFKD